MCHRRGDGLVAGRSAMSLRASYDAVVVGSAIVAEMERLGDAPDVAEKIGEFTRALNQ